jgi:predicted signal transduction protein with EAL and GGDEF domain
MEEILGPYLARLKEPFFIDGHEIFASASIGVSFYPGDGQSFETLCANADRAMYRSKGSSKGTIHFFDSSVGDALSERVKTEQRLRLAIRDQRLGCAYQPKVDFRSGKVVGLEVLLRWRDEDGFIHPPGDFVNLAVELGLMDQITHLVLAETVGSIDRINEAFGEDVTISVNVAAKQADQPAFMRSFIDALIETGYPNRFMVEVTEEAFLAKNRFQSEVLPMIRAIGAKVSIDDFGVGYSSLSALADITADEIKVDRSFITAIHQRPRSQSILKAIESLATALDMSIVVEGVESVEELTYLQAASRIRVAQGYYFARPQFLDEFSQTRTIARDLRAETPPARALAGRATIARGA